jgi:exodeoxyribonuclease VII large subunit
MSGGSQLFDPESPPLASGSPGPSGDVDSAVSHPTALSIGGLYDAAEVALHRQFPRNRPLWVRGEIAHLSDHRSGHLYLDLIDPDDTAAPGRARPRGGTPTLRVTCWRSTWAPLRHTLGKEGIELAQGMVVVLRGTLDLYRAKGELSFILVDVDVTALLGQMAAARSQLLHTLESEGLLRKNASVRQPELALQVGLVASPDTEGCRDFLGQLVSSGYGFRVSHVKVPVQGPAAPASIARALTMLSRSECDVVAMVRGGGARADLAAFETEVVARAVAGSTKPVFTGIGHSGDQTVADVVAARSCITPTECGHQLVVAAHHWWTDHVAGPAEHLARRVPTFLSAAETRHDQLRRGLARAARHHLVVHGDRLAAKASLLRRGGPAQLTVCESAVRRRADRLGPLAAGHLGRQEERLQGWRRLLAAYDVERQLERGYSLTLDAEGALVRSAGDVSAGQELVTRFADGAVHSTVVFSGTPVGHEPETETGERT